MADDLEPMPDGLTQRMFPSKSTEELVNEMVAADPGKHGITVKQRLERARAQAGGYVDSWAAFERSRILEVGGDPEEMMPGNKPRWTVDEDSGAVKDHDTGQVYGAPAAGDSTLIPDAEASAAGAPPSATPSAPGVVSGASQGAIESPSSSGDSTGPAAAQTCEHDWGSDDPAPYERCKLCHVTFEDWCNG